MYGSDGSTRKSSVMNINNSPLKTYVDNWYRNNIATQGTEVTDKISDTLFCGDRQIYSGTGAGTATTSYESHGRFYLRRRVPTLKCGDRNDRFTVNDVSIGNGDLTYPVGLITADEVSFAGGTGYNSNLVDSSNTNNRSYYLHINDWYWTMTPHELDIEGLRVWLVYSTGDLKSQQLSGMSSANGRPLINLKPDVEVTGNGSTTNPFKVV